MLLASDRLSYIWGHTESQTADSAWCQPGHFPYCCEAILILGGSYIVMRQPHYFESYLLGSSLLWHSQIVLKQPIVVRQPHCIEAASLLWGHLIDVRPRHCWEAALSLWGSLIVVGSLIVLRQLHFYEAASKLWGSLIDVRYPHCCEVASIFEAAKLMKSQGYWGCLTKIAAYSLKYWGYLIETTSLKILYLLVKFSGHLVSEFTLSWFLNLLILVPQARLLCLRLFTTLS